MLLFLLFYSPHWALALAPMKMKATFIAKCQGCSISQMKKLRVVRENWVANFIEISSRNNELARASTWVELLCCLALKQILSQRLLWCVSTTFSLLCDSKLCIFPCLTHKPNCCRWDFVRTIRDDEQDIHNSLVVDRGVNIHVYERNIEKKYVWVHQQHRRRRVRDWVMTSFNNYNDPQSRNISSHDSRNCSLRRHVAIMEDLFRNSLSPSSITWCTRMTCVMSAELKLSLFIYK